MGRPKAQRLSEREAAEVRELIREGEALGDITHADIDRKLDVARRPSGSTWTGNTLNRDAGLTKHDAYRLLHGVLKAVPVSKAAADSRWRLRVVALYDRYLPVLEHPTARAVPPMYVSFAGIDTFSSALSEFLATYGVHLPLAKCREFLTRPTPGQVDVSFRQQCAEQLAHHAEWAIDEDVPVGRTPQPQFIESLRQLDAAFDETVRRRKPKLDKSKRLAKRRQVQDRTLRRGGEKTEPMTVRRVLK